MGRGVGAGGEDEIHVEFSGSVLATIAPVFDEGYRRDGIEGTAGRKRREGFKL